MRVPAIPELVSAPPLLATAVLALNDHLLKRRCPGVVTGKLSDLAGAFVMPLFVSAALAFVTRWSLRPRLAVGVAVTVGLLCAVKLSPWAARLVTTGLDALWLPLTGAHGGIVPDRTDLVALPLSVLAYAYGMRAGRRTGGQP
jgi:hypothetical protein